MWASSISSRRPYCSHLRSGPFDRHAARTPTDLRLSSVPWATAALETYSTAVESTLPYAVSFQVTSSLEASLSSPLISRNFIKFNFLYIKKRFPNHGSSCKSIEWKQKQQLDKFRVGKKLEGKGKKFQYGWQSECWFWYDIDWAHKLIVNETEVLRTSPEA